MLLSARPEPKGAPEPGQLRILDIGCGNGAQTIQLAKHTNGSILAVDNHRPFLDELERRAEAEGVSTKITVCLKDMRALGMEEGPFDLIWSEGALYIMGFGKGLAVCHGLLRSGGLLAVSELSWFRPDPPGECQQFFANEYHAMADIDTNVATIEKCGYETLGRFALPESAWWVPYYQPLERRLESLRDKYATDPQRIKLIESVQTEIEVYRKYSAYYGYVFYLMQRS